MAYPAVLMILFMTFLLRVGLESFLPQELDSKVEGA
jgi:hypothetical protein